MSVFKFKHHIHSSSMCSMCHYCGAELAKRKEDTKIVEHVNSLKLGKQDSILSCKCCEVKLEQVSLPCDGRLSSYSTPMISPTSSFSSSDRSTSGLSEISVDMNLYDRSNHGNHNNKANGQLQNLGFESSVNGHSGNGRGMGRQVKVVPVNTSIGLEEKDTDAESSSGSLDEEIESSYPFEDDSDAHIWEPPEPEDPVDDIEGSVAFNDDDDDDECGDGTEWGNPSSLSPGRGVGSGSYKFKEEKQRAMEEVTNGKFKGLVCQLLKSVGVVPYGEDGENWTDIVTSLSWEAASFLKPDAVVRNSMDPDGYVKVKCVATGIRSQSQVVKGLVFKKHAAHKHMPTKYKSPKLLLIRGALGQSSSGLSSFGSMEQEKDYLKSVVEMLDLCHPNVVLVEKSVSRDIQESILKKGMTLVFDMKLHRLERVARCTGSSILSSDSLMSQKLKQCDAFYVERFVEDLVGSGEGGKKPSKTLMFIEGCPTRRGCTILLKGAHSEELKRVKCVIQCAVIMAYHLILETSFLVDQRAMLSTIPTFGVANAISAEAEKVLSRDNQFTNLGAGETHSPFLEEEIAESESPKVDIPISSGFHDVLLNDSPVETELPRADIPISNGFHGLGFPSSSVEFKGDSLFPEPYNPEIMSRLSSFSTLLAKSFRENFPIAVSSQLLPSYFHHYGKEANGQIANVISAPTSPKTSNQLVVEDKSSSEEDKSLNVEESQSLIEGIEATQELKKDGDGDNNEVQSPNGINVVLDSQSILVLMSKRNALRGTVCEQSHFSHIMFYKNFDIPLGKFLRDNLLNEKTQCGICGELPESHLYYYAHNKRQLTIKVKRLPTGNCLPGEAEGKIWMWGRCGRCTLDNAIAKSTKRVLISTPARGLSFGKFLELGFSHHASARKLSTCGHSLHRDFLYYFGLGNVVAMFRYSPVATYTISMPPWRLKLSNSLRQDLLIRETENVYMKGMLLFTEVEKSLKKVKSQYEGLTLNLGGSLKEFSDIEEMLKEEISEFEVNVKNAVFTNGNSGQAVYQLLSLNGLLWDLLLESCIWDRRIHSLLSPDAMLVADYSAGKKSIQEKTDKKMDGSTGEKNVGGGVNTERGDPAMEGVDANFEEDAPGEVDDFPIKEIPVEGPEESKESNDFGACEESEGFEIPIEDDSSPEELSSDDSNILSNGSNHSDTGRTENTSFLLKKNMSESSLLYNSENSSGWFWAPFAEIRGLDMRDLQRLYFQKFESLSGYTRENLPTAYELITHEGQRLHIPLGTENYIVSDHEGELSSIISCALALLKEGDNSTKPLESFYSLTRIPTVIASHWSSNASSDSDTLHVTSSMSLEESRFSSFDGLNLLESLVSPGTVNPVVPLGYEKSLGKSRYTVICPYANQFRDLRSWCCPSELDYIASLSRCRNWDAKGGKSKSFFAKTLDDRLIIKEIKKTEFESFMKFADEYFKYMKQSYELGNQTCLAKVFGIYQVIVRNPKSGKETKHDLMVMENLTFGRKITRQYDLKGALHARFNTTTNDPGNVLLDQNFVNDMNTSPLYVSNKAKRHLERAIWNDTTFLNSINVMDYSLLVVVDSHGKELVCGIIDYLRQYTWDKQLETWVKSSLVPKNVLPTVISPIEYKGRFRKFMSTHFLSVPDHWCSEKSSDHCELCGARE